MDISQGVLAMADPFHHQRNLKRIKSIDSLGNSKGTPEGGPSPRGGALAGNGSFSNFHAVSSRSSNSLI